VFFHLSIRRQVADVIDMEKNTRLSHKSHARHHRRRTVRSRRAAHVRLGATLVAGLVLTGSTTAAPALASTHKVVSHKVKAPTKRHSRHRPTVLVINGPSTPAPAKSVAAPGTATPVVCTGTDLIPTSGNLALVETATVCLINQQRVHAGLAPLVETSALDSTAQGHSNDMVSKDYFSTVLPTGADPSKRAATARFATPADLFNLGETIAAGSGSLATPAVTVAKMMTSTDASSNPILDPSFREIGSGIAAGVPALLGLGSQGATYTEDFSTTA
jgi:uncharacterized protein YkwD